MKRKKKKILIAVVVLIVFWFFENFIIDITTTHIKSTKVNNTITIVQISDLHGYMFGINNSYLLKMIDRQHPDVIAVTGDMFTKGNEGARKRALKLLKALSKKYPVYYVRGEHEGSVYTSSLDDFVDAGIFVLDYKKADIKVGDTDISIYGYPTSGYYSSASDTLKKLGMLDKFRYNILLSHIFYKEVFANWGADLILSGDTHGGMVRLPFIGPITYQGVVFPKLKSDKDIYDKGLFKLGNTYLYVNAGLGNYPIPLRLFNRPELTVLQIDKAD
ncbi:metallophosphoesterase [Mahella sp.]|uniref:metallophosphoesterase n=1 Tax=Mahella sp. TaxID=2798721 RepID=UPI0025BF07DA|nr:metallophosphoesterase [Mahella sp.]MBZ4666354.1 metallophosphoesterase [Mahella sp.]